MQIELLDLISKENKEMQTEVHIDLEDFQCGMDNFAFTEKSPLKLHIQNTDGHKLMIKASGHVVLKACCDRCLEDVLVQIPLDFSKEFAIDEQKLVFDDLDEAEYIEGQILDTDRLVYDEILVNWPMKVLCKDDCKGICNKCGINLNLQDCTCDRTVVDPRMAAIQDIFNKFKEV